MSNRFELPSAEELARRGLNEDGTPVKKAVKKAAPKVEEAPVEVSEETEGE